MRQTVYNLELTKNILSKAKPADPPQRAARKSSNGTSKSRVPVPTATEDEKAQEYYERLREKHAAGRPAAARPVPERSQRHPSMEGPHPAESRGAHHSLFNNNSAPKKDSKASVERKPKKAAKADGHKSDSHNKSEEQIKVSPKETAADRERERVERCRKRDEERRKMKEEIERRKRLNKGSAQDVPFCLVQHTFSSNDSPPTTTASLESPSEDQDNCAVEPEAAPQTAHTSSMISPSNQPPTRRLAYEHPVLEEKSVSPVRKLPTPAHSLSHYERRTESTIKDEIKRMKQMALGSGKATFDNFSEKDVLVTGAGVQIQIEKLTKSLSEKKKGVKEEEQHHQDVLHMVNEMKNVPQFPS